MIRIPGSTYRLQLHKDFTFDDAAAVADYLTALGITHVYSSPYLQAAPNSMHGYDVVDHRKVNEELGGAEGHARFCKRLGDVGLGQVLDIVPNHMSLGEQNRYWWDVLENGTSSRYASFFDIDWNSAEERLRDKVLVPILGDQYGRVLESGGIKVSRQGSAFTVEAAGQSLPVAPQSLPVILGRAADSARSDTLSFLAASYGRLPMPDMTDRGTVLARHRDKVVLDKLLERLCAEEREVCGAIDRSVRDLNENGDGLDDFLNQQSYRLSYWKTADQQLGYRRFFDVNTLIGLRVEREYVFEETHALILKWLKEGVIDGVRVDHPDGLRDPLQYFERLRAHAPNAYIVGEKILARGEFLRESWPIEGTSGYGFLNMALGLLVDPDGMRRLSKVYGKFTGEATDFPPIAHDKKLVVEQEGLASDVNRLTNLFVDICESNREQRDFTRTEVRRAIREIAACFGVYRTYVMPDREEITDEDLGFIERAAQCGKDNRPDIDGALFDFMRDVLAMKVRGKKESEFVARFQQFTSPVMAKGVEDTAFYCFNRLTAMNEVGGDPGRDGVSLEEFHDYNAKMQKTHPGTMLALSTHDTKRSDDVRARLAVLPEIARDFGKTVMRWSKSNARFRTGKWPDKGTEWLLYQTMVGAWPIEAERLKLYMQKATREAKLHTSWMANNEEFEVAVNGFIEATLSDGGFIAEVEAFVEKIVHAGRVNSLAQTLLKHTSPGVPDLYQGSELWDLSLVDPDNRRPVDYELRRKLLTEVRDMDVGAVMTRANEGLPKLWLIHRALRLRCEHAEWFGSDAEYAPIAAAGDRVEHVVAYRRGENLLAVAPRWMLKLGGNWGNTTLQLPAGKWRNWLTDEWLEGSSMSVARLLERFPVALLTREG
ncbi:MAG: malto-oligosyltrehalose synthase [Acidobacteriota bacterium]|nr:malto-oligosyltrehalose synthase [Acidobacteriota bacterium]